MKYLRHILLLGLYLFCTGGLTAGTPLTDSLKNRLNHTTRPGERIDILLNLKDLYEGTDNNLYYSLCLFEEARKAQDLYALGVAIVPIVQKYAVYIEKKDSLDYYLNTLHSLTRDTPEEGMAVYAKVVASYNRFYAEVDKLKRQELGRRILQNLDTLQAYENKFQKAGRLFLAGIIDSHRREQAGETKTYIPQIPLWREAWELALEFPGNSCKSYLGLIYFLLSGAYNQAQDYDKLIDLTHSYMQRLDLYYTSEEVRRRRKYLYKENIYVKCYNQLMRGALYISDELAYDYYQQFRDRMLSAKGDHLRRNKIYLYETGYLLLGNINRMEEALSLCDSLIHLIEVGQTPGYARPLRPYHDKAILLRNMNRFQEACQAYQRTLLVSDSLMNEEYRQRVEDIRRNHDVDELKLEETHLLLKNRQIGFFFSLGILIIVAVMGMYYYKNYKKTKKLQGEIARQNIKAQESEQMKSIFINSICQELHTPFRTLNFFSRKLTHRSLTEEEKKNCRNQIQESTTRFLSILDNLLEAANLDSLSEGLPVEEGDINPVCISEMKTASGQSDKHNLDYQLRLSDETCIIRTHIRYFSLVIRALLNNSNKFTQEGFIRLVCLRDEKHNRVTIQITDSGCGIPPDKREDIFKRFIKLDILAPGNGLGLPFCRLIAKRLYGDLTLDPYYTTGTRFIFTLPIHPEL